MARLLQLLVVALVLGLAGCGDGQPEDRVVALGEERSEFARAGWRTDFSRHTVPLEEIRTGGPPRDGIPPIDKPRPVDQLAAERFLSEREPVIAVEVGGAARAYPVRILVWHEIVNDRLGGRAIAVTYCPLCNSSLVFDRRVGGRRAELREHGQSAPFEPGDVGSPDRVLVAAAQCGRRSWASSRVSACARWRPKL